MRRILLSLLLGAFCCLVAAQQPLNNDAIIKLVKSGMSDDFIVSTISNQPGNYDASPDAIIALKNAGASDRVMSAVVQKVSASQPAADPQKDSKPQPAPEPSQPPPSVAQPVPQPVAPASYPAPQAPSSTSPLQHTLLDGTPVKLRLSETISSADAKVGQEIPFEVIEDVSVDQVVVLPKGSVAMATVTDADHKKSMGRAGKLDISISYARLKDQEKAALRATKDTRGGGHTGAMTGAMVATAIVFFPAAPLFLFIKGKDTTIPQGTEITAFVEGDMHLDMRRFDPTPVATNPSPPAASPSASLAIDSTPEGADIEIDSAFVGNTPSTIPVSVGSHQITVNKKGFVDWTKTLAVTGGSIHLSAVLDQEPAKP